MALNPIIEAFLAAREQASRDFAGSENRRLQGEQQAEQAKQFKEQIAQQLKIHTNELAQRKALADAEHALTLKQLEQSALISNQRQSADATRNAIEAVTKGLVKQNIPGLVGNENAPVGQIGQMDQMLTQIPGAAPQVGMTPNPVFESQYPGGREEAMRVMASITPHEEIRQEHIDDLEMASRIKQMEATQRELERFNTLSKVEGIKQGGLTTRSELDRRAKSEEGELNRKKDLEVAGIRAGATLGAASIRASKKAAESGVAIDPQTMAGFIDGSYSLDDFVKQFPSAKDRTAAATAFRSEGYRFLSKADQKLLDRAGIIAETQRNVHDLVKLYDEGYKKNFKQIRAKQASIDSVLGNLARGVSGEAGVLTQSDIDRVRGIVPSFVGGMLGTNQLQAEQLDKYTKNTFGHIFKTMRDDQSTSVANRYSLLGSGIVESKGSGAGSTPKVKFSTDQVNKWGAK